MNRDKTYFLSDAHLGAGYIKDHRAHENIIVRMLQSFGRDASHIYLLGDILDYWFEYKTVVPRGYVRFFGELARLADSGVKITWLIGNHDIWMFDYLRNEIGIEIIDGEVVREINGKRFYIAHGDQLGKLIKPGFRFIQAFFRNRFCQKMYSAIHPRWTVPLALRWSSGNRKKHYASEVKWIGDDFEPSVIFAKNYLAQTDPKINFFIFGHRHISYNKMLSDTCEFVILGDCYKQFAYAVWDGNNLELKQFVANHNNFNIN